MIRFWPFDSTKIGATPLDAPGTICTCDASMPCAWKLVIVAGPNRSSPTRATIDTSAPHSRAATAWLAPLPPQPRSKLSPKIVSPAFGKRSENVVRSTLALPTTAILDRLVMSPLRSLRPRSTSSGSSVVEKNWS